MRDNATRRPDGAAANPFGWFPALVFLLLMALVAVLWWTLDSHEADSLGSRTEAEALHLAEAIETDLANRIPSLERMAKRWELSGGTPKEAFTADARAYLADIAGLQAIEWVDSRYYVRWIVPLEGNEQAQDLWLGKEKARRLALERARDLAAPSATTPVDLVQGGKGFLMYFPLSVRGEFGGFILAVYRMEEWLTDALGLDPGTGIPDFAISVAFDGVAVYSRGQGARGMATTAHAEARLLDHRLTVTVRPTQAYVASSRSLLPLLTAGVGALFAFLIAFIVSLLQRAMAESWRANATREALESEAIEHRRDEEELEQALARLDMATKAGAIGVWSWDVAGGELAWNEQMYTLFDLPQDVHPTYDTWRNALHPEDRETTEALLLKAVEGKAVFNTTFRIILSTGAVRHLGAAARVARDGEGTPRRVTGINYDLTQTKAAEEALRKSEGRFRLLLNSTAEAIYGIDLQGDCTFANPACVRLLRFRSAEDLIGRNMHWLIHHSWPDGKPMPQEECHIFKAFRDGTGVHRDDEVLWRSDGTSFPVEYWSFPQVQDGERIGAVVTFTDITERRESEEKIRHLATHDSLTDLPRMPLARDRLGMAIGLARRYKSKGAVMFVDLDGFKGVNDSLGHDAGDFVLRQVALRLAACVRETDTVARVGGDEFLVIASGIGSAEDASRIAANLLASMREPMIHNGNRMAVGASVGIALFPDHAEDIDRLVKLADEAMYSVKKAAKNGWAFARPGGEGQGA